MPNGATKRREGPSLAQGHTAVMAIRSLRPSDPRVWETEPRALSPAPPKLSLDLNLL